MKATKEQIQKLGRLKKRAAFLYAQGKGKKWVSKSLIIMAVKNPDNDTTRFGLTVTKRVDKRAVVRNRIRRRLRALSREVLSVHAKEGYDYVLIGRRETLDKPYDEMVRDLRWCLKRLECRKDSALKNTAS